MKTASGGTRRPLTAETSEHPRINWVRMTGSTAVLLAERWADILQDDLRKGDNLARTAYRAGLEDAIIIATHDHRRRTSSRETRNRSGIDHAASLRIGRRLITEYARPMAAKRWR